MMIRLILDEAADECVRELMRLTAAEDVGTVFQEALTVYRAVVHAGDAFEKAADVFAKLGTNQPDIAVTEHAYENNPT